jgi:ribonuclease E
VAEGAAAVATQEPALAASPSDPGHGAASESVSRRQDPDLVAVPMEPDQELVYGWMGLSPALLLDPAPTGENLVVRIVRPGEDQDAVLEAARQQLAASGSRRRRRGGRGGGAAEAGSGSRSGSDVQTPRHEDDSSARQDDSVTPLVEITPLPDQFGEEAPPMTTVIESTVLQIPVSQVSAPAQGAAGRSPSRGRHVRRTDGPAVAVAEAPAEAPSETSAPETEPGGEPRRRRRRSSAAV